jgi:hypothetical protein
MPLPRPTPQNLPGVAAAAIILAGAAAVLWLNLPGHLSYDSVVQLAEGRAGVYTASIRW